MAGSPRPRSRHFLNVVQRQDRAAFFAGFIDWRVAICRRFRKKNHRERLIDFCQPISVSIIRSDPGVKRSHWNVRRYSTPCSTAAGPKKYLIDPFLRLAISTAQCKWPAASDNTVLLALGLMDAALYNAVHRNGLRFFFNRALFFDSRNPLPLNSTSDVETLKIPLSARNLKDALLASGSVPLLMQGVNNIPDAPEGMYRDGGIIDYHFDLPILQDEDNAEGLILFPHYTDRIIPGWFDKHLPWRKPRSANVDRLLLIAPSRQFVARLRYGRIPDRDDFWFFKGRNEERLEYWDEVIEASAGFGDEFLNAVETGEIRELVKPLADLV